MSFSHTLCRMLRSPWLRTEPCSFYLTSVSFTPHFPANWRRARAPGPNKTPGSLCKATTCSFVFFIYSLGKVWNCHHLLCGNPPNNFSPEGQSIACSPHGFSAVFSFLSKFLPQPSKCITIGVFVFVCWPCDELVTCLRRIIRQYCPILFVLRKNSYKMILWLNYGWDFFFFFITTCSGLWF